MTSQSLTEAQAEALLDSMTLTEKVSMLAGASTWMSTAVPRLDIPAMKLSDGPNAARGDSRRRLTAACFPVGSAMAATWNTDLIEAVGHALGAEAKSKDIQILLGPTINLHRHPAGGRHFECYSEDPVLTGRIAVGFIRGVQAEGVGACAKHFVCNDSEFERHTISSQVDPATLRELYLRPFEMAVREARVWSVMSAYNRINGIYASSHRQLLLDILKDEWGFDGIVVSDWGAALETEANANGGLDLEMPGPTRTRGKRLLTAVETGRVDPDRIDDSVRRVLRITARAQQFGAPERAEQAQDLPEHRALARRCAAASMVLLKNEPVEGTPILPLAPGSVARLAVIGPNAAVGQIQGGGSSAVIPHYHVTPLQGLTAAYPHVDFAEGCRNDKYVPVPGAESLLLPDRDEPGFALTLYESDDLTGTPSRERELPSQPSPWGSILLGPPGREDAAFQGSRFSAELTTRYRATADGAHTFGLLSSGLCRLFVDGALLIDNWSDQEPGDAFFGFGSTEKRAGLDLEADRDYQLRFEFQGAPDKMLQGIRFGIDADPTGDPLQQAIEIAAQADAVVLVAGSNSDWETEGNDRADLDLPGAQDALIRAVLAANPRTVVVLNTGAPMTMPWIDQIPAVLQAWLPGQEFGNALADVLSGSVDCSGRLPTTFPVQQADSPAHAHYPGENGVVRYTEAGCMGYRGYLARNIKPLFAFGHGLSYTQWQLSDAECRTEGRAVTVHTTLANVGDRAGSQVVQVYLTGEPEAQRDDRLPRLVGFAQAELEAGERTVVSIQVAAEELRRWHNDAWRDVAGRYTFAMGFAADNLIVTAHVEL